MTSEVLILNKHAVALAADSAVTTSPAIDGEHPRYSKTASKLFELSKHGNVAVTIYGGAQIDLVPWELVIKIFRSHLGGAKFPTFDQYLDQLLAFIGANPSIFPSTLLDGLTAHRFDQAVKYILERALARDKTIFDKDIDVSVRQAAWGVVFPTIDADLTTKGVHASLSSAGLAAAMGHVASRADELAAKFALEPELAGLDSVQVATLATRALFAEPTKFLPSTGVVVAGYGEQDIFPGFKSVDVFGHVGAELVVADDKRFQVTHTQTSMIQALAQTAMIDVFTDGFGISLWQIIRAASRKSMEELISTLSAGGATIPQALAEAVTETIHQGFMKSWTRQNFAQNYQPLKEVLATLGVQEMAHLAETLLTLESLKERVTSSSESVGGPIDVAAITKSEGLIWLKRKHFFTPDLNLRYVARLNQSLNP
jgi:hypothetical protein